MASRRKDVDISDLKAAVRRAKAKEKVALTEDDVRERLCAGSFRDYKVITTAWKEFVEQCLEEDDEDRHFPFQRLPSVETVEVFLAYLVRTSPRPLLGGNISDITLKNRLGHLKRAIKLHTDNEFSKEQKNILNEAIKKRLPVSEGVCQKAKEKPVASFDIAKDLVTFAWTCDEHQFSHPRVRLQLMFAITLFTFLGSRPGELVESDAWRGSNTGLLYEDIELHRQNTPDYCGFVLHLKMRYRKGARTQASRQPTLMLYEEKSCRFICPVLHFVALALADGVLEGCTSFSDVEERYPIEGSRTYKFPVKSTELRKPVMRSLAKDSTISKDMILRWSALNDWVQGLGQRAGYEQRLNMYCFRRGYANAIDKHATGTQTQQLMGHINKSTLQAYASQIVGIDSQALVQGRAPQTKLIELNLSMALRRNIRAPQPPGSRLTDNFELDQTIAGNPKLSNRQIYDIRRRKRQKQYLEDRSTFFNASGNQFTILSSPSKSEIALLASNEKTREPSRYLRALLRYDIDRNQCVKLLFESKEASLADLVEPMRRMACPSRPHQSYPGVLELKDGCCPYCKTALEQGLTRRPKRTSSHLLRCFRRMAVENQNGKMKHRFEAVIKSCLWNGCGHRFNRKTPGGYAHHVTTHILAIKSHQCLWNGCRLKELSAEGLAYHLSQHHGVPNEWTMPTAYNYCHEHRTWKMSLHAWDLHLELEHAKDIRNFCGIIRQNGLVVVAGQCLFCLGNSDQALSTRFTQFHDGVDLRKHMESHLDACASPPPICPHPNCEEQLGTNDMFWQHATKVHGITPYNSEMKRIPAKRKALDEGGLGDIIPDEDSFDEEVPDVPRE